MSLLLARPMFATTPAVDISSAGPLTHVWIGNDLSCQVEHTSDAPNYEFFPAGVAAGNFFPADSGTFIFVTGDTLYAPDIYNHPVTAASSIGIFTPFSAVSQTAVTGSGTGGDPYTVVTVVDLGATGLNVHQTDTYVTGNEFYSTSITINNTSGGTIAGILYRAGDSFMGVSDSGYGFTETLSGSRNAVGTSEHANNTPPGKIIEWISQTGGNNYVEGYYDGMWSIIGTNVAFPDTCQCSTLLDNGAGISWNFSIAASGSATFAQDTKFQPVVASPTPTASPSPTATAAATFTPTATATATATATSTPTPSATATNTPTPTPSEMSYSIVQ